MFRMQEILTVAPLVENGSDASFQVRRKKMYLIEVKETDNLFHYHVL